MTMEEPSHRRSRDATRLTLELLDAIWEELPAILGMDWERSAWVLAPLIRDYDLPDQRGRVARRTLDHWLQAREEWHPELRRLCQAQRQRLARRDFDRAHPIGARGGAHPADVGVSSSSSLQERVAEMGRLHWETHFPEHPDLASGGTLLAGCAYRITTGIVNRVASKASQAACVSQLRGQSVSLELSAIGCWLQPRTGAGTLRRRGDEGAGFGSSFCTPMEVIDPERPSRQFDFNLLAPKAGEASLDLSLVVNNSVLLQQRFEFAVRGSNQAVASSMVGGASPAAAPKGAMLDAAVLEPRSLPVPPADLRLEVIRTTERYEMRLCTPDRRPEHPCKVRSSGQQLRAAIITARNELNRISRQYRANAPSLRLEGTAVLEAFATVGATLYREIFGTHRAGDEYAGTRAVATTVKAAKGGRLQIVAPLLPIPWELLYDGRDPSAGVEHEGFWGVRFSITRVTQGLVQHVSEAPTIGIRALALLNPSIDGHAEHYEMLRQQNWSWAGSEVRSNADLKRYIESDGDVDEELLYFFCHAGAAASWDAHGFAALEPAEEQAYLQLDREERCTVDMMRQWNLGGARSRRPFVFLNACASAQGDSEYQSPLLEFFRVQLQSRAVLGTEWLAPAAFASAFAQLVLSTFRDGQTIGEALANANRLCVGTCNNPFSLMYALHGRPDLRVEPAAQVTR